MSNNDNEPNRIDRDESTDNRDGDDEGNPYGAVVPVKSKRKIVSISAEDSLQIATQFSTDKTRDAMTMAVNAMAMTGAQLTRDVMVAYAADVNASHQPDAVISRGGCGVIVEEIRRVVCMEAAQIGGCFKINGVIPNTSVMLKECTEFHRSVNETLKEYTATHDLASEKMYAVLTPLDLMQTALRDNPNGDVQVGNYPLPGKLLHYFAGDEKNRAVFHGGAFMHAWNFYAVRDGLDYYIVGNSSQSHQAHVVIATLGDGDALQHNAALQRLCYQFVDPKVIKGTFNTLSKLSVEITDCPNILRLQALANVLKEESKKGVTGMINWTQHQFYMITFFTMIAHLSPLPQLRRDVSISLYKSYASADESVLSNVVKCGKIRYTEAIKGGIKEHEIPEVYLQPSMQNQVVPVTFFKQLNTYSRIPKGDSFVVQDYPTGTKIEYQGTPYSYGHKDDYKQFFTMCRPPDKCVVQTARAKEEMAAIEASGGKINEDSKALWGAEQALQAIVWRTTRPYLIEKVEFPDLFEWTMNFEETPGPENFIQKLSVDANNVDNVGISSINWSQCFAKKMNIYDFVNILVGLMLYSKNELKFTEFVSHIVDAIGDNFECALPEGDFVKKETGVNALKYAICWIVTVTVWTVDRLFNDKKYSVSYMRIHSKNYSRDMENKWFELPEIVFSNFKNEPKLLRDAVKPIWNFTPATVIWILAAIQITMNDTDTKYTVELIREEIKSTHNSTNYAQAILCVQRFLTYDDLPVLKTRRDGSTDAKPDEDDFSVALPDLYKDQVEYCEVKPLAFITEFDFNTDTEIIPVSPEDDAARGGGNAGAADQGSGAGAADRGAGAANPISRGNARRGKQPRGVNGRGRLQRTRRAKGDRGDGGDGGDDGDGGHGGDGGDGGDGGAGGAGGAGSASGV